MLISPADGATKTCGIFIIFFEWPKGGSFWTFIDNRLEVLGRVTWTRFPSSEFSLQQHCLTWTMFNHLTRQLFDIKNFIIDTSEYCSWYLTISISLVSACDVVHIPDCFWSSFPPTKESHLCNWRPLWIIFDVHWNVIWLDCDIFAEIRFMYYDDNGYH